MTAGCRSSARRPTRTRWRRSRRSSATPSICCPGRPRWPRWSRTPTPWRATPGSRPSALVEATGFPAVADDTGLFVDALGGAPGVWSARYAGPHATYAENRAKLLARARRRPGRGATARFRTVALVRWPDGGELAWRASARAGSRPPSEATRVRLRPGLRARRRRRADVRRDDAGREARPLAPRSGLPGAGGRARRLTILTGRRRHRPRTPDGRCRGRRCRRPRSG